MKKLTFSQAEWIPSKDGTPLHSSRDDRGAPLPEIALVGRSNVGKSSLINHLLKTNKHLAKTSSTPGKTREVQFFLVDRKLLLVDLPGYGYAKISKAERSTWGDKVDTYLQQNPSLKGIVFLCDSRRTLTEEDHVLLEWTKFTRVPILVLFTKADKLKEQERKAHLAINLEKAKSILGVEPNALFYSIKEGKSRPALIASINRLLEEPSWD